MKNKTGPIDLYKRIPKGCICTRTCWDRILDIMKQEPGFLGAYWCKEHNVTHRFSMEDPKSIAEHPNCELE